MRDFVKGLPNMKVAFNFHAWGPLFIYPFMYDNAGNSLLTSQFPEAYQFYERLSKSIGLSSDWKIGNAMQTIEYRANGDASDWMLGELGIFALSVELGGVTTGSRSFFISNPNHLMNEVMTNEPWIYKTMLYLLDTIECTENGPLVIGQTDGADTV